MEKVNEKREMTYLRSHFIKCHRESLTETQNQPTKQMRTLGDVRISAGKYPLLASPFLKARPSQRWQDQACHSSHSPSLQTPPRLSRTQCEALVHPSRPGRHAVACMVTSLRQNPVQLMPPLPLPSLSDPGGLTLSYHPLSY